MKKIFCFSSGHQWKCIDIFEYDDVSYGNKVPSIAYTRMCSNCSKLQTDNIYGTNLTSKDLSKLDSFNTSDYIEGTFKN